VPTDDPALPAVTPGPPTGNAVLFTSTDRGASMPSTWTARTVNKERAQKGQSQTASRSST
jgi:hypothetical protein